MLAMNKDHADCAPLLESTASALNEEAPQMLLISALRTNIQLSIKYAVERSFTGILTLSFTWHLNITENWRGASKEYVKGLL